MIGIISYGLGNIKAIQNVYQKLSHPVKIIESIDDLSGVNKLILPGVGAFDYAMEKFNNSGLKGKIVKLVLEDKVPILGICVGAQMLCSSSDEGRLPGLNWIDASVKKFQKKNEKLKLQLPHMGWNNVKSVNKSKLFDGLHDEARFYFLHSYYIECRKINQVIATSEYPNSFVCSVNNKNIYGVQFHPEKSHQFGINLLDNFYKL